MHHQPSSTGADTPTVVFFHAHPDDEAIFTGGTIARLVDEGARVVVVLATGGERGVAAGDTAALGTHRRAETMAACGLLGVHRVAFLGYTDSGLTPPGEVPEPTAFALADVDEAAGRLAAVMAQEDAATLVLYDEGGIYGHADHLAVHRVGRRAAERAGIATVYEATVDREYLHFVATHLVELAALSLHHDVPSGVPTAVVTTTLDVRPQLDRKRGAMAAHASQIPPDSEAMQLDAATFAGVYGYEWYIRTGPRGVLDDLAM